MILHQLKERYQPATLLCQTGKPRAFQAGLEILYILGTPLRAKKNSGAKKNKKEGNEKRRKREKRKERRKGVKRKERRKREKRKERRKKKPKRG